MIESPQINLYLETGMSTQCSWKTNSNPPVCQVHNELLIKTTIPIDEDAPDIGVVICYVCPVSKAVVNELKKTESTIVNG